MRVLRAFGWLLLGLVLVLGGFLLEAHYEIRGIRPPLPELEQLAELRRAGSAVAGGPESIHVINTASQSAPGGPTIGHHAILLRWADGRAFLIDAGMERDGALAFGKLGELVFGGDPIEPLGSVSAQLGEVAKSVEGIAFTHLHSDHTGGAPGLCSPSRSAGSIAVFQTPDQTRKRNYTTAPGAADLEAMSCARFVELPGEAIVAVPGFAGLYAIAAGGHTPGSTLYAAVTPGGLWIFSGDVTNLRANLLENRAKPKPYSLLVTPEDPERLERLRTWLAALDAQPGTRVVVSHDVDAMAESGLPQWPAEGTGL